MSAPHPDSNGQAASPASPIDHEAEYKLLLSGPRGSQILEWSKKHAGMTAAYVFNADPGYARWAIAQYDKNMYGHGLGPSMSTFDQSARFFKELFQHSNQLKAARLAAANEAVLHAKRVEEARKNMLADEERRVKVLRRSTANGQLESALSFDLLVHICLLTNASVALTRLPCVSRGLRTVMGTGIQRLPSIAKLIFKSPTLPPKTKQSKSKPRDITLRMMHNFLIEPITNVDRIVTEGEAAFVEHATRVALHRSEFESIREQAKALRNDAVEAYLCGEKLMHDAFAGASRTNLDDTACTVHFKVPHNPAAFDTVQMAALVVHVQSYLDTQFGTDQATVSAKVVSTAPHVVQVTFLIDPTLAANAAASKASLQAEVVAGYNLLPLPPGSPLVPSSANFPSPKAVKAGAAAAADAATSSTTGAEEAAEKGRHGCQALVRATNTALEKQHQLCALMKKLAALNKEHKLGVSIPSGQSVCNKKELCLVKFLGTGVCVNKSVQ
jgi:hypothetical protein